MAKVKNIRDYYKQHIGSVSGNLGRMGEDKIAGMDTGELVNYCYSVYKLPTIVLLNDGNPRPLAEGPSRKREHTDSAAITIRFDVQNEDKLETILNFENEGHPEYDVIKHDSSGLFIKTDVSLNNAVDVLESYRRLISEFVQFKNKEIEAGNAQFKEQVNRIISECKSKLKAQSDMLGKLSKIIPLTIKENPSSPLVPLAAKKQIVINPPQPRVTSQPKIDQTILDAIIDILFKGGHTFETAPETFTKLEEEDLRNILVSFLNGNFELRAVGEAFNKLGKSDISLLYSGNNLFIAECKYWGGTELYGKTIDQLFRYLTWRENIGVLIWFVRQRDFNSIIDRAIESAKAHATFISNSLSKKRDSYFITKHVFPDDKDKVVEVHHLLFTLYSPRVTQPQSGE